MYSERRFGRFRNIEAPDITGVVNKGFELLDLQMLLMYSERLFGRCRNVEAPDIIGGVNRGFELLDLQI
jgi:hypothetical protein